MADRVKYFLLGLLFLVVAGVIAYDRWNTEPARVAQTDDEADRRWEVMVGHPPTGAATPLEERKGLSVPPVPDAKKEPAKTAPAAAPPRTDPKPAAPLVAKEPAKKKPPQVPQTHVVRSGETLESIALKYYQSRKGVQWIVLANKLRDPNRIYINQKLIIPARKELKPTVIKPRKIPSRYEVKPGDGDLYAICRRFYGRAGEGARVARIMELNHLWSAEVKPGTVLILPPKEPAPKKKE
ncbi:MAG: LysM peptidoglycan-binding domain-containing protein [Planctomycetota bacterium]|jgi:nucleoid-associated protein YgaU